MTSIGSGAGVRWGWVLLGAVLLEVCTVPLLGAYMWVLSGLFGIHEVGAFDPKGWLIAPPFFLAVPIPFGLWIALRARQRFVLHGALVGLIAALLFVPALWMPDMWAPPGPNYTVEAVNSVVKVLGGAVGGVLASRWVATRNGATRPELA